MQSKKKICFILTAEIAVRFFLINHLRALSKIYDITLIVNCSDINFLKNDGINISVIPINIDRKINLLNDIVVLFKLIRIIKENQFLCVHTLMPKAGLLGMLAAYINRIPHRIHMFTGQVWADKKGLSRYFLKLFDYLIASLTTVNLVDGHSQLGFLVSENILSNKNSIVFANGSIAGVDTKKFKPDSIKRDQIREKLGIPDESIVFIFIGRINIDKGVIDLAKAFQELNHKNSHLIFVGPDEDSLKPKISEILIQKKLQTHFIDYTSEPQAFMAAADILCLPSFREGFNNVIIEAAAVGIPSIATNIYGIRDSVINHETGLLHEKRNIQELSQKMDLLAKDSKLRLRLGKSAHEFVKKEFPQELISNAWVDFYSEILAQ
jgi:glycosyltransferase involved in cell wall biosynthesis